MDLRATKFNPFLPIRPLSQSQEILASPLLNPTSRISFTPPPVSSEKGPQHQSHSSLQYVKEPITYEMDIKKLEEKETEAREELKHCKHPFLSFTFLMNVLLSFCFAFFMLCVKKKLVR